MNKLRQMYKEFFRLSEATTEKNQFSDKDIEQVEKYTAALEKLNNVMGEEAHIEEAQLVNHITDYRGGIEYVLRDPSTAQQAMQDILDWSSRKGFTLIKKSISKSGKVGYLYFRLGEDPALESQKLQGYLAQMPELKHFRFNVRQDNPQPSQPEI